MPTNDQGARADHQFAGWLCKAEWIRALAYSVFSIKDVQGTSKVAKGEHSTRFPKCPDAGNLLQYMCMWKTLVTTQGRGFTPEHVATMLEEMLPEKVANDVRDAAGTEDHNAMITCVRRLTIGLAIKLQNKPAQAKRDAVSCSKRYAAHDVNQSCKLDDVC